MNATTWLVSMLGVAALAAGCAAERAADGVQGKRIAISVTEKGFEPAVVKVAAGKPATLVVTRTTDRTCARDFVMSSHGIRKQLPLNQPVEIVFTPERTGDLRYACAMDMIAGTVRVE